MSSSSTDLAHAASGSPIKILVVEDHPAMRAAVIDLLGMAFPGNLICATDSAEQAMQMCDSDKPRVVIMDIALPGMSGIEATRRLSICHPDIQVVMHSNSDMPVYQEESFAAGACAFVSKGRTSQDLIPVISGLLV